MVLVLMSYITYLLSKLFRGNQKNEPPENFLEKYKKLCEVNCEAEYIRFEVYQTGSIIESLSDNDTIEPIYQNFKKYNKLFLDDGDICSFIYQDDNGSLSILDVIDPHMDLDSYDIIVPVVDLD